MTYVYIKHVGEILLIYIKKVLLGTCLICGYIKHVGEILLIYLTHIIVGGGSHIIYTFSFIYLFIYFIFIFDVFQNFNLFFTFEGKIR